jgi:hypothetical protein
MSSDSLFQMSTKEQSQEFNNLRWFPDLCTTCRLRNLNAERIEMCDLIKAEGREDEVFICVEYDPDSSNVDKEMLLRELFRLAGIQHPHEHKS